ncbi:iron complex transport system permease protein [Rhodoblastus acidophilus]|uniref:FecCD family ABC transporter permease n=1 Tax=Rhodoblastus acidophilus TaxID=1074 RepID=UPI002225376C|nr:iron ABC transporter permease [Rhodoblastus acidophilus]MCW2285812.1 iron complex transport system permease protein [Rhodoblastus acidophilus]MCW2333365.1 iron complex transport system permease protein [Rhodoblastus acidophilus]
MSRAYSTDRARTLLLFLGLVAALLATCIAALSVGRYGLSVGDILGFLASRAKLAAPDQARDDLLRNILVDIRLPRILAAAVIGAALSVAGAAYQSVFRNPLASPGLLGALGGASFGAALALILGLSWIAVQGFAFAGGIGAVALGVGVAGLFGEASTITLILGGMISGAFFTAALSILKYAADPYDQLPAIVYWLMGSLAAIGLTQILWTAPLMLAGMAALALLGRPLDALAMGEDEARGLGVPVAALRYGAIAAATFISALSVSLAGMIGWIGLFAPHFARLMVGPGNARLLPASALVGAIFLIAADTLARSLTRTEIPIGIITELLGIPAFILVLRRARKGWM